MVDLTSEAAKRLAEIGAPKGGRARANVLSPEERSAIARKAVNARWAKSGKKGHASGAEQHRPGEAQIARADDAIPYSIFQGKLRIGDLELECHVLSDFRRVFTQREVVRILSGGRESGNLQRYLERNPLISNNFYAGASFPFRIPAHPSLAVGWESTGLIEICDVYLRAKDEGKLKKSQFKLVKQAQIVMRACAKVGIIALVDEATGFQQYREKQALQLKLQAFIAEDLQDWAKMFPDDFWYELARLEGVRYSPRSRPLRWGRYVMAFVYDAVDQDVGKRLREVNPDPHYKQNHHQWLKEFGRDKVHDQITKVVTIMKLCNTMQEFTEKFSKVFKKASPQLSFEWMN
jgi:hypothetical protein